ncbi:pantoate--beta-alanine ligase [Clostridiales bacterium PH28_bin88]|nr:pantoate--beta-alanine ligase [Clostridiales bacterium PH28_bin88]
MRIIHTVREMRDYVRGVKLAGHTVALVPTMGYLHEGHLALMRRAKERCDVVVASIFVNPKQFGVGEDFERYPRDMARDARLAEEVGVDAIFNPPVEEMYPAGYNTYVEVEKLTEGLCGAARPGHFRGVTTVVNKLFNIVQPDVAFFGQKDAQQAIVIRQMVADLNMPLEIVIVPIVREPDGLAMSSRNVYLTPAEREAALVLYRTLQRANGLIMAGERSVPAVLTEMRRMLEAEPLATVDYVEIRDAGDLSVIDTIQGRVLVALAVFIGRTRLIDNLLVEV